MVGWIGGGGGGGGGAGSGSSQQRATNTRWTSITHVVSVTNPCKIDYYSACFQSTEVLLIINHGNILNN